MYDYCTPFCAVIAVIIMKKLAKYFKIYLTVIPILPFLQEYVVHQKSVVHLLKDVLFVLFSSSTAVVSHWI